MCIAMSHLKAPSSNLSKVPSEICIKLQTLHSMIYCSSEHTSNTITFQCNDTCLCFLFFEVLLKTAGLPKTRPCDVCVHSLPHECTVSVLANFSSKGVLALLTVRFSCTKCIPVCKHYETLCTSSTTQQNTKHDTLLEFSQTDCCDSSCGLSISQLPSQCLANVKGTPAGSVRSRNDPCTSVTLSQSGPLSCVFLHMIN